MKKNTLRLFALLICAVMLFSLVPGKANAVALSAKKMPQMQTITYNEEWQMHEITEFADLQHLAIVAANDPGNYYNVSYDSYNNGEMIISQNIEIPENLFVNLGDIVIPAGVKMVIDGSASVTSVEINGTLVIDNNSHISVNDLVAVKGNLDLRGTLYMTIYCSLSGGEKISYNGGWVSQELEFKNATELQKIIDKANAANDSWKYVACFAGNTLHFPNPMVLPENVLLACYYGSVEFTGAQLTIYGGMEIYTAGPSKIANDIVFYGDAYIGGASSFSDTNQVIFGGKFYNSGYLNISTPVVFAGPVQNMAVIDVWYNEGGTVTFNQPQSYVDTMGEKGEAVGIIWINAQASSFPTAALKGLNVKDFEYVDFYEDDVWIPYWGLYGYTKGGTVQPPAHTHTVVTEPAVAPTCLEYGWTEGAYCATCGEVLVEQQKLAALGHDYGLAEDGKTPDFWDTTCDVCGAERKVDKFRPTHSMYRMFNPNSGEHFYTGDKAERQMLEAAGWQYEGVGFTFPASTGKPVYRLFQPSTGEHLYTMDEAEKAALLANGWNYEGIAFNSGNENEVPQYRLWNPNATVGAYHFTASLEEREVLLAAGWQDQGIGFYTCWQ